jgi:hypothetical protein
LRRFTEAVLGVHTDRAPCRNVAAEHSGKNREAQSKSQNQPVEVRLRLPEQGWSKVAARVAQRSSGDASQRREQKRLSKGLPQKTTPARTQRHANAKLSLPGGRARQQQAGKICTGKQQHQCSTVKTASIFAN